MNVIGYCWCCCRCNTQRVLFTVGFFLCWSKYEIEQAEMMLSCRCRATLRLFFFFCEFTVFVWKCLFNADWHNKLRWKCNLRYIFRFSLCSCWVRAWLKYNATAVRFADTHTVRFGNVRCHSLKRENFGDNFSFMQKHIYSNQPISKVNQEKWALFNRSHLIYVSVFISTKAKRNDDFLWHYTIFTINLNRKWAKNAFFVMLTPKFFFLHRMLT